MPNISLTDFVEIASTSGTPKMTKVRQVKTRPTYSPAMDFYKPFRDHVTEIHRQGLPKRAFGDVIASLTDQKKISNYPPLVEGYRRWWGRKALVWFEPHSAIWSAHGVDVRVNPELGLVINGTRHLIKLYMKADPLSKARIDIITHLMDIALSDDCDSATTMSVLDVRRHNLISPTVPIQGLTGAVDAELAYIAALWPNL